MRYLLRYKDQYSSHPNAGLAIFDADESEVDKFMSRPKNDDEIVKVGSAWLVRRGVQFCVPWPDEVAS